MQVVMSYCQQYVFKVFNIITNKSEAKTMVNMFDVVANANSIVQLSIQIKNGITK